MSRIGKLPVVIPAGVTVTVANGLVTVKGAKGTLSQEVRPEITVEVKDNEVVVTRSCDDKEVRAYHGLYRQLINNMVIGVSQGYTKTLLINGVGYKAEMGKGFVTLSLGYSTQIDYIIPEGINCFGATKEAIKLEDDRAYSRAFTQRHGIPVPENNLFSDVDTLSAFLDEHKGIRYTIKSNSMAPSRVMLRSSDKGALISYAELLLTRGPILLENYIHGTHITATLFIDNNGYLLLPCTNEYTNVSHENGTPTGGMGAIAPLPLRADLKQSFIEKIVEPTIKGMREEGCAYKGVLTLSVVIDKNGEPYLVDYHVRLNDPATQAMAPIIKTDLGVILYALKEDRVSEIELETTEDCSVAVVLAAPGYPMQPEVGREIKGLSYAFLMEVDDKPKVFLGAVKKTSDGRYFTDGGRAITVVGTGISLQDANEAAYKLIGTKKFDSLWYRDDIGNKFFNQ